MTILLMWHAYDFDDAYDEIWQEEVVETTEELESVYRED